jgi:hypothetical protein
MPVVLIILGMIVPTAAAAREGQTRDRLPGDLLTVGAAVLPRGCSRAVKRSLPVDGLDG